MKKMKNKMRTVLEKLDILIAYDELVYGEKQAFLRKHGIGWSHINVWRATLVV